MKTVRQAARDREPLSGVDAQGLEGALAQAEQEINDLKNFVRFLSETMMQYHDLRGKAICEDAEVCKEMIILKWPMLQGIRNQMNMKEIGRQKYEIKSIGKTVQFMLKN